MNVLKNKTLYRKTDIIKIYYADFKFNFKIKKKWNIRKTHIFFNSVPVIIDHSYVRQKTAEKPKLDIS